MIFSRPAEEVSFKTPKPFSKSEDTEALTFVSQFKLKAIVPKESS